MPPSGTFAGLRRHGFEWLRGAATGTWKFTQVFPQGPDGSSILGGGKATMEVPIPLQDARVWDDLNQVLPDTAATDDLGLVHNVWATSDAYINGIDPGGGDEQGYARWLVAIPPWYKADSAAVLRITFFNDTSLPDGTSTIDAVVHRVGAPTVDICATALQDVSAASAATDFDFTLTDTDIVPGDILDIRIDLHQVDVGNAAAIVPTLTDARLLLSSI